MSNSHYYEDGSRSGREESPAIEYAFQDEVTRVIKELLETKSLYQNLRLNDSMFAGLPGFLEEFKKRPISPNSRGEGDDARWPSRLGGQPLGTPDDELEAGFYLPNITIDCSKCKCPSTFLSMTCSAKLFGVNPYPILGEETEQVFSLYYRCATCRNTYVVFQVLRKGLRLQLTGRSTAFRPAIAKEWPKEIKKIIEDAYIAAAEGDLPAAYYHVRTAIEFHLKAELGLSVATKIDGTELCDKYNAQADERLKQGFPTFGSMYSELSAGLHSREVNAERFSKICHNFISHLKAKELFAQFASP